MSLLSILFGKKSGINEVLNVLNAEEFRSKVEGKKVQLIDVRTPNEFKSGHIKGAKNIDFFSVNFINVIEQLDKQKAVYLYCRSGGRSRQASKRLMSLGFQEIYDLKGGIMNYR